jgi:hypothetical protein
MAMCINGPLTLIDYRLAHLLPECGGCRNQL